MIDSAQPDRPRPARPLRERIAHYVHGADDIFISYSRLDGFAYAAKLASALAAKDFSCGFDQWRSEPSRENPKRLIRAVAHSQMLVVIGTKEAGQSAFVGQEIDAFPADLRMVVPVDVDGSLRSAAWWPKLAGLSIAREPTAETGAIPSEPSAAVVEHILGAVTFTKRDQRLKKRARGAVRTLVIGSAVALLAFGVAAWQFYQADTAQLAADSARTDLSTVDTSRRDAVRDRDLAQLDRDSANDRELKARAGEDAATQHADVANRAATAAETRSATAEANRLIAEKVEQQSTLLTRAQLALNVDNRAEAVRLARSALELGDSPDGRLILADAYNRGLPRIERRLGTFVRAAAVNPANENELAYITVAQELAVTDLASGSTRTAATELKFFTVAISRTGELYAVAREPAGEPRERRSWLLRYDRNLKEADRILLPNYRAKPDDDRSVFPLEGIQAMSIDDDRQLVILSGAARGPEAFELVPLLEWIDLPTRKPTVWVDVRASLGDYLGTINRVGPSELLTSAQFDLSIVDMRTSQATKLADHPTEHVSLAASPDGAWVAGCSRAQPLLTIAHRVNAKWHPRRYPLNGGAGCAGLVFYKAGSLVAARTDGTVTLVELGRDIDVWRTWDRFEGETIDWEAPVERQLGNAGTLAELLQASPDGRWILTADERGIVRLWSPYEYATVALPPASSVSTVLAYFHQQSDALVTVDEAGLARVFDLSDTHRFTIPVDPNGRVPEFSLTDSAAAWRTRPGYFDQLQGTARAVGFAGDHLWADSNSKLFTEWDTQRAIVRSTRLTLGVGTSIRGAGYIGPPPPIWTPTLKLAEQTVEFADTATKTPRLRIAFASRAGQPPLLTPENAGYFPTSPKGSVVAFRYNDNGPRLCVVDMPGRQIRTIAMGGLRDERFDIHDDGTIVRWDGLRFVVDAPGRPPRTVDFPTYAETVATSKDHEWFAAGDKAGHVRLYHWQSDRYVDFPLKNPIAALAFSPRGTELAAASGVGVHLWYVPSGDLSEVLPGAVVPPPIVQDRPSQAWPPIGKDPDGRSPVLVTVLNASAPAVNLTPQPGRLEKFLVPALLKHIDPTKPSPDPDPATFAEDERNFLAATKGDAACWNEAAQRFIGHGRSAKALGDILAKFLGGTDDARDCVNKMEEVAPSDGALVDAMVTVMKAQVSKVNPINYALNDRLLEDLDEQGVPADSLARLRTREFEIPMYRAQFERAASSALGASLWSQHREAILATAGLPRRQLSCDGSNVYQSVYDVLANPLDAIAPEAVRAEPQLREALARFGNCADIATYTADLINRTAEIPR